MCFYPRHPRGWRLPVPPPCGIPDRVSIHATLAGGDFFLRRCREGQNAFLSTPPSRVATESREPFLTRGDVSIHATLAGGDAAANSEKNANASVSIHATLAGGDDEYHAHRTNQMYVSIHATLAGGDAVAETQTYHKVGFYPRHPRGWRRTL